MLFGSNRRSPLFQPHKVNAGLYSLSEGDKTGETDTGQRQSQTIINRFSEPVVIHEVEGLKGLFPSTSSIVKHTTLIIGSIVRALKQNAQVSMSQNSEYTKMHSVE